MGYQTGLGYYGVGLGGGFLNGINAAVSVSDARGRKEERERTAADYAYNNQVIGTVGDFAGNLVSDLDDPGKEQVAQVLSQFLGDTSTGLRRKDIPMALSIMKDPTVAQQLLAVKEEALGRQLRDMPPDDMSIERKRMQAQLDAIGAARGKPVREEEKDVADIGYKTAQAELAREGKRPTTAEASAMKTLFETAKAEGREPTTDEIIQVKKELTKASREGTLTSEERYYLDKADRDRREAKKDVETAKKEVAGEEKESRKEISDAKKNLSTAYSAALRSKEIEEKDKAAIRSAIGKLGGYTTMGQIAQAQHWLDTDFGDVAKGYNENLHNMNPETKKAPQVKPPRADARQGNDGKWYVPDPNRRGKYLLIK